MARRVYRVKVEKRGQVVTLQAQGKNDRGQYAPIDVLRAKSDESLKDAVVQLVGRTPSLSAAD